MPDQVEILYPHRNPTTWEIMTRFYTKYYGDSHRRIFMIGINPGRHGAGTTGIPFTDPIRLQSECLIDHHFELKPELSSKFIYLMIEAYGGVDQFYRDCYFTSVSPYGFIKAGKNLNYYDRKELQEGWETFMVESLKAQMAFGACKSAFSLGQGKNHKYLLYLNQRYQLFDTIHPLPHPRWIMQYRLKKVDQFVSLYCESLSEARCRP